MASSSWTQLARVTDRSPLLEPLRTGSRSSSPKAPSPTAVVVKIRPRLLHFLVDSRVWCVIRSKVPITDVADYGSHDSTSESMGVGIRHKLLVTVADGNVWIVTLPDQLQPGVTSELVLDRSSTGESAAGYGRVQWFCQLPGVQSVEHVPAGSGRSSLTLMRSLVTPTTLIVSTRGSSGSKLQHHQSLELDEIEGEQSTCTFILDNRDSRHKGLLGRLFPEGMQHAGVAAVLQGDLDGSVRFALIQYPCVEVDVAKASLIRSGVLLQVDQPVQMIAPFTSSTSPTPVMNNDEPPSTSLVFDALLMLGVRGQLGIVHLEDGNPAESLPVSVKKLEIGRAVQSLAFVNNGAVCVYCSKGLAFVCRSTDLLAKAQYAHNEANGVQAPGVRVGGEQLQFQPGIVRLAVHAQGISILFAAGRVTTIREAALRAIVAAVLPLQSQPGDVRHPSASSGERSESRVRNLLKQIAQVSAESTTLRTQSQQMDRQLESSHSALEMLRLVETAGVGSVTKCELSASIVTTGTFSDRQTIKLVFSFRFVSPDAAFSLDNWWVCNYVRAHQKTVTTYSFPLKEVLARKEQSIVLKPETLSLQDQGYLWVSCSLIFCPSEGVQREMIMSTTSTGNLKTDERGNPLSFAIPLLQDRRIVLAQLSRPIEDDISVSQVAINAAFRQSNDPFMPVERAGSATHGHKSSPSALWSGVQWWAALADYAQTNPSFADLWARVAPSDAAALTVSPPSRFVMSIPSFFAGEDDDEDDEDEAEDFEKIRVERIVSFLRQLLEIPIGEVPQLRRSCRTQHGKLWAVLRTFSDNLILLRFTPSEDQLRSVDLTIQCSDVADLSAMRALVLDAIGHWNDGSARTISEEDRSEELALDVGEMLEPITALENILQDLTQKVAKGIEDPQSAMCTDEVLHGLSQLAHLETQTLALYWKTRVHLNRTIM